MKWNFKKGDRVWISPESEYGHQSGSSPGTVVCCRDDEYWRYDVEWDSGCTNCYREFDLIPYKNINPKKIIW